MFKEEKVKNPTEHAGFLDSDLTYKTGLKSAGTLKTIYQMLTGSAILAWN